MNKFPKSIPIKGRVRICLNLLINQGLKNKTIIDIGSSFGWLEKEIQNKGAKKIIGIEYNKEAVKYANKNIRGAQFKHGSALDLPLKKNVADIVCLFDVIEHVPRNREDKVLDEVNRVLRKNGILLLSTPFNNPISKLLDPAWYFGHRHYSKIWLKNRLKKAGFKIISLEIKGSIFSSLYLIWFYLSKKIIGINQPRNRFFEWLDDRGYNKEGITDLFIVAKKI